MPQYVNFVNFHFSNEEVMLDLIWKTNDTEESVTQVVISPHHAKRIGQVLVDGPGEVKAEKEWTPPTSDPVPTA